MPREIKIFSPHQEPDDEPVDRYIIREIDQNINGDCSIEVELGGERAILSIPKDVARDIAGACGWEIVGRCSVEDVI